MSHDSVLVASPYCHHMLPTLGAAVGFITIVPYLNPLAQTSELLLASKGCFCSWCIRMTS